MTSGDSFHSMYRLLYATTRKLMMQVREEQHLRAECVRGYVIRKTYNPPTDEEIWAKIEEVEKELAHTTL